MSENPFRDELLYLMQFISYDIEELVDHVINDSDSDPQYSAVTAQNMILCYIEVMKGLGKELPYNSIASFFHTCCFTDEEYDLFEKKRKKEAEYYIGKQYYQECGVGKKTGDGFA